MKLTTLALMVIVLLMGCATAPEIKVRYEVDQFGVPVPIVNGERYPLSDAERKAIGQSFVNAYCS